MPIDDSRPSRFQRPAPAPAAADEANLSTRQMQAIHQLIHNIDAGREKLIPWDAAAERWMFEEDA